MKVWLLENEQKAGPYESFEIREWIDAGSLKADTMAWYQGAPTWEPLSEIPQFETLFPNAEDAELDTTLPIPLSVESQVDQIKEALDHELSKAPSLNATRRLFAKLHDCILCMTLVFVVFQERALDTLQSESMFPLLGVGLAYVIIDGIMTHLWKCSPGKFLLGMRITDAEGHAIPLPFALLRSLRAWVLGLGMWVMWPLALLISWFVSRRFGYFLWDMPKRYRTVAKPFSALHVAAFTVSIFAMYALLNYALPKEMINEMNQWSGAQELLDKMK